MFESIRSAFSTFGPGMGAVYLVNRACQRTGLPVGVYPYVLVVQPVLDHAICPPTLGKSLRVRPVAADDPAVGAMPIDRSVVEFRRRQPTECFGAFQGDELVAYLWLCNGPYDEDEVRCRFIPEPEAHAVWDFDVFVFPARRLGPAFSRLWDEVYRDLGSRGVRWTVSRISALNPRSMRVHSGLKARPVGRATFVRIGPVQVMLSSMRPRLHIGFGSSSRPVVRVPAE